MIGAAAPLVFTWFGVVRTAITCTIWQQDLHSSTAVRPTTKAIWRSSLVLRTRLTGAKISQLRSVSTVGWLAVPPIGTLLLAAGARLAQTVLGYSFQPAAATRYACDSRQSTRYISSAVISAWSAPSFLVQILVAFACPGYTFMLQGVRVRASCTLLACSTGGSFLHDDLVSTARIRATLLASPVRLVWILHPFPVLAVDA